MGVKSYIQQVKDNVITTTIDDRYTIEDYDAQTEVLKKQRPPSQFIIQTMRVLNDPAQPAVVTMAGYVN